MKAIPFYSLDYQHSQIKDDLSRLFDAALSKNRFILGTDVSSFEEEFAAFHGIRFCVGVGNGFDALYLSLLALNVGGGDEVIVPAHTYTATWLAVSRTGATPVPVDIHPRTWLIDADKIEAAITPRTRAILPVHLYGAPCDMDKIMAIAKKHNLKVVEDNAQGAGADYKGKKTGTFGQCNAFSFYPTKNLGALGDGGAILTDSEELHQLLITLRNYGQENKNNFVRKGVNSRLDELQAAFLRVKLQRLKEWNKQRATFAEVYQNQLKDIRGIAFIEFEKGATSAHHIFPIICSQRNELQRALAEANIETMVHYPTLPYQQEAYKELSNCAGQFPMAEKIAAQELSLPLWPGMKEEDVEIICNKIRKFNGYR